MVAICSLNSLFLPLPVSRFSAFIWGAVSQVKVRTSAGFSPALARHYPQPSGWDTGPQLMRSGYARHHLLVDSTAVEASGASLHSCQLYIGALPALDIASSESQKSPHFWLGQSLVAFVTNPN